MELYLNPGLCHGNALLSAGVKMRLDTDLNAKVHLFVTFLTVCTCHKSLSSTFKPCLLQWANTYIVFQECISRGYVD